jgi:hypothetical protein
MKTHTGKAYPARDSAESPPCGSEFAFIGVNSRFPKTLLARATWLALPATRAVARNKQQKKGK